LSITCLAALLLSACGEQQKAPEAAKPSAQPAPVAAHAATPAAPAYTPASSPGKSGNVLETMNAGGYTYVQVDTGKEKFWAAGPETKVKVGDTVAVPEGMPMPNFESKSLKRKFDMVYFVPSILAPGAAPAAAGMPAGMPGAAPSVNGQTASPGAPKVVAPGAINLKGIAKADQTVADIYAQKAALAGKPVKVRGKVVKVSSGIMGKNWLHVQDGSGQSGSNDLTVTTSAEAKPGDTVVISGKLAVAKDFGYGYKYDVIVEDAQVTKE
jgi:hypothetical protein